MNLFITLHLHNKRRLLLWIISPAVFLAIFYFLVSSYFRSENTVLQERKDFVKAVPVLEQKIALAQEVLDEYKGITSEMDALEMLNSRFNQIAYKTEFTLNSLSVEKENRKDADKVSIFKVAIKGAGSLVSVIGFYNEIYELNDLFVIDMAKLRVLGAEAERSYEADFLFSYYSVQ
ncbi:MAG: hypothetical protein JW869_00765 [Candidatus Omnitrophica bacterium]|nr:hypothetical protein [Candidatus Omnitrophota bacterium]